MVGIAQIVDRQRLAAGDGRRPGAPPPPYPELLAEPLGSRALTGGHSPQDRCGRGSVSALEGVVVRRDRPTFTAGSQGAPAAQRRFAVLTFPTLG